MVRAISMSLAPPSEATYRAEGALWEVQCAIEEGVPAFGVRISSTKRSRIPKVLKGRPVIKWTWAGIHRNLERALTRARA